MQVAVGAVFFAELLVNTETVDQRSSWSCQRRFGPGMRLISSCWALVDFPAVSVSTT